MLSIKTKAPDFSASDQDGKIHNLADYAGQWLLLYFYPRDNTPGCTVEACSLRDNFPHFEKLKTAVVGVSTDSVASHGKFASKYSLPFTLLADPDHKIIKAYQADGFKRRISYLIDPSGVIVKAYYNVKPANHAEEVLEDLKNPF
jgi:peroxiredoxin Q/BCP